MKFYVGTKILQAEAMSRGEYVASRGWTMPADENPEDDGFRVVYQDGYVSWTPREQFEEAYLELPDISQLQPYQVRVVAERIQLDDRIGKLRVFHTNPSFGQLPIEEQYRLTRQLSYIVEYSAVLAQRISTWSIP